MSIEERLKLYKKNKTDVEMTLQRVEIWQNIINKGEFRYLVHASESTLGMPKAPGFSTASPIEKEVCQKEITKELVEQWIEDDKSRIWLKKMEVEQIEKAMESLLAEEQYLIECKYFEERWTWRNIEITFNDKFKNPKCYLTQETLKKMNRKAVNQLVELLTPFYKTFNLK